MAQLSQRSTIYFDPNMHKALRLKAAQENRSVQDIVNEAVSLLAAEDAEDIAEYDARKNEPSMDYSSFVSELKNDGIIQHPFQVVGQERLTIHPKARCATNIKCSRASCSRSAPDKFKAINRA